MFSLNTPVSAVDAKYEHSHLQIATDTTPFVEGDF